VGTLFTAGKADGRRRPGRSRWIGSVQPAGRIVVDEGARAALVEKHKSLLPAGVVGADGDFEAGDIVAIVTLAGAIIARGQCNYRSDDVRLIAGKRTREVKTLLAEAAYDEVIHRDNLVME
jgi:glutamate 5-kinase